VPIVSLFVTAVCLSLAAQLRESLAKPSVRALLPPLCLGALLGVPVGVSLLTTADPRVLRIILGLCMLSFVLERTLHELGYLDDDHGEGHGPGEGVELVGLFDEEQDEEQAAAAADSADAEAGGAMKERASSKEEKAGAGVGQSNAQRLGAALAKGAAEKVHKDSP